MSEPSRAFFDIGADLVFDYGISEVIRKVTHGDHVLLRRLSGTGGFT